MFTKPEPSAAARRVGGHARTSTPASSGGRLLGVEEHEALRLRARRRRPPRATSDGSSTTTTSGSVIVSWRRIGRSETRVNARSGAPRRSGPYSGNACTPLPFAQQRQREDLGGRLGALAGARVPADLGQLAHRSDSSSARDGALCLAHGLDDAGAAVDGVAGGEDLRVRGPSVLVDGLEQRSELLARPLADRLDDRVDRHDELAAREPARAGGGRSRRARRAASPRTGRPRRSRSPTNATGFVRKRISTPSRRASSTSCS